MAGNRRKHRRTRQRVGPAVRLVPRKRKEIDRNDVAMVYFLIASRMVRDKRAKEARQQPGELDPTAT